MFSYLIVLLIPLIIIGIFSYNHFTKILETEISDNNLNALIKVKNSVDVHLNTLQKIPVRLLTSDKFRPFHLRNNPINAVEVKNILSDYSLVNDFIHEIVFYVRGHEYFYSSSSSYTTTTYTKLIYQYQDWTPDDFYNDINTITHPLLRPAENVLYNRFTDTRMITFLYPIPSNTTNPYATLMFLIKEDSLKDMIGNVIQNDFVNTILLDENGTIITSLMTPDYINTPEFQAIVDSLHSYGTKTELIGNVEYFLSYVKSLDSGWTYVTVIPSTEIMGKVIEVKMKVLYSTIFILFFGIFIIYLLSSINYSPLKKLSETAKKSFSNIPDKTNEIEATQLAFRYWAQDSEIMHKKIISNKHAHKEFLLMNLLQGSIKNIQEFNEQGKETGLYLTKPFYRVILFLFHGIEINQEVLKSDLIFQIEQKFSDEVQAYGKSSIEKDRIIFILSEDDISTSMLEVQVLFLQQWIKNKWELYTTIGIGNRHTHFKDIAKSYIQACSALDYKLIKGEHKVIFFNEIVKTCTIDNYPKDLIDHLELSILQMDVQTSSNIIVCIMEQIKENNMPLFMARCLCFDIINTVIKTTQQFSLRSNVMQREYPDLLLITDFHTLDELSSLVQKICFDMCDSLRNLDNMEESTLLNRMICYVEKNYNQYTFSVQGMADDFGMSSSNLSHYFKEQTHKTLSEYTKNLRIEKAKDLLKNTDRNLQDIVESIGYSDVSSFIKKFRQLVGSTPGEYRKSYYSR